ncbi:MAG TPA: TIGR00645 family protein, partial [Xanthobacteraceae bacterium]|nr:TIGR00645 family protein [Xanthobacteraceae bacterium]
MSMAADDPVPPKGYAGLRPLPQLIFSSRWLQLPLYVG